MTEDTLSITNSSTPIMAGAQPFLLPGGPVGVLIIHGYGGSPGGFKDLADQLNHHGYTVLAMRVAGHGLTVKELGQTAPSEWPQSVEQAILEMRKHCQDIVVMGISFGGDLGLVAAAKLSPDVKMIITLNTPLSYRVPLWKRWLIRSIAKWRPYYRKPHLTADEIAWNTKVGSLTHWPVLGVLDTERFIKDNVRPALPKIRQPTLIISTEDDPYVDRASAEQLLSELGSPTKEIFWVAARGHRPLRDPKLTANIVNRIHTFIQQHIAGN